MLQSWLSRERRTLAGARKITLGQAVSLVLGVSLTCYPVDDSRTSGAGEWEWRDSVVFAVDQASQGFKPPC